ncbi:hypothetical protein VMCG_09613 [Cytospora schulzeri]|uniref:Uncharacterized protein n=1 Tax=Cytospora schulzeri TaxID=448051 RepID=A0A423VJJ8_9PEZI|nr:hypothetical protein VMCG_09613 [Valsa malicola]
MASFDPVSDFTESSDVEIVEASDHEDDVEDSLDDVQAPGPQFQGLARGPLGALSIVNNRQMIEQQLREMEDVLSVVETDQVQVDTGGHGQEWAELNATLEKLIKKKDKVRSFLEVSTEKADARYSDLDEWMKKFSSIADLSWDRLFTLRDKLPPNMGPALIRLVAFYYPDDISMDELPNRYKELLRADLRLLAQASVPPAPSQSVPVLKENLLSARRRTKELEKEVAQRDATIEEIQLQLDTKSSEVTSLGARLDRLKDKYEDGSARIRKQYSELQNSMHVAEGELKTLRKEHDVKTKLLVDIQEKKQALLEEVQEAKAEVKEKDGLVQQLTERVQKLVEVGKDSGSALTTLKGTVRRLQESSTKKEEEARKTLERLQEQARSARDRQQQRIDQKDSEIDRLKTENDKIGLLEREKGRLEQQVATLGADNTSLNEKQRVVDDRISVLRKERQELQSRNAVLDMAVGAQKTRVQELQNKYDVLEQRELGLIKRDEWFREHVEKSDSSNAAQVNELTRQVAELQDQVRELSEENNESTRAIEKAQVLVSGMDQLKVEVSRRQAEINGLQEKAREGNTLLANAIEECNDLNDQLGELTETVTTLQHERDSLVGRVDEKSREILREREKARSLKEELDRVLADYRAKSNRVTSLEGEAQAQGKELARLVDEVAKLGDEVTKTQSSLGMERGRAQVLEKTEADIRSSLEALRRQYDEIVQARDDSLGLLEKERARCEKLEEDKKKLGGSLEDLRVWQLDSVRQQAELEEKNRTLVAESVVTKDLKRQISKFTEDISRKDQEISQARASLGWWEKSHSTVLTDTTDRIDSMDKQIRDLTDRLSQARDSLDKAERQAHEGVEGLQGFLARLCLTSPEDPSIFAGLARQLQSNGGMQSQRPAQVSGWSILVTWGEEEEEEMFEYPSGMEMMALELFRAAVTGRLSTRRCHLVLKGAIELVSTSPTIHAGVFSELASVFVKAVEAQPRDGFVAGLAFWQLLSIVEQRWQLGLVIAKDSLTAILDAHEYRDIFEVVVGHKSPGECEGCHFFTDTLAVLTRDAPSFAALVDTKDRSVRFFAKSRWRTSLWDCFITPPGSQEAVRFEIRNQGDFAWAHHFR